KLYVKTAVDTKIFIGGTISKSYFQDVAFVVQVGNSGFRSSCVVFLKIGSFGLGRNAYKKMVGINNSPAFNFCLFPFFITGHKFIGMPLFYKISISCFKLLKINILFNIKQLFIFIYTLHSFLILK